MSMIQKILRCEKCMCVDEREVEPVRDHYRNLINCEKNPYQYGLCDNCNEGVTVWTLHTIIGIREIKED